MNAGSSLVLLIASVLAACASQTSHDRDAAAYELYHDFAGPPVDEFTYLGKYDSWRSLGRNVLAVQTGVNAAYLLTLQSPCHDLSFASAIALTSTGHTVRRDLDYVRVGQETCTIWEIRPVNYSALQKARREDSAREQARREQ